MRVAGRACLELRAVGLGVPRVPKPTSSPGAGPLCPPVTLPHTHTGEPIPTRSVHVIVTLVSGLIPKLTKHVV